LRLALGVKCIERRRCRFAGFLFAVDTPRQCLQQLPGVLEVAAP